MARNVIRVNDDALKLVKQTAKIYGLDENEAAEKLITTGSSRLGSLRKDAAKRAQANGTKPRKKAKKKVAKKAAKAKGAAKPRKKAKKKTAKKARKGKSLADRAKAARGGASATA